LLLVVVAVAVAAIVYLTSTDAGRRDLADRLEDAISREIPGAMTIGWIERVGSDGLTAHDLRFLHPNGEPVLTVDHAQIDLDPAEMLTGTIAFERARVQGGHLIIAVQPDGRTGLEAAFSKQGPSSGKKARLQLRSIHVQDLTLTIQPDPETRIRMRGVQGFVTIVQDASSPGVRVKLDRIASRIEQPKLLGERVRILRASGFVHGAVERVLDLDLAAELGDDRFDAHFAYFDREKHKVQLTIAPKEGIKTRLAALGAVLRSSLSDELDVRVE
jgi:hypothetical protein